MEKRYPDMGLWAIAIPEAVQPDNRSLPIPTRGAIAFDDSFSVLSSVHVIVESRISPALKNNQRRK